MHSGVTGLRSASSRSRWRAKVMEEAAQWRVWLVDYETSSVRSFLFLFSHGRLSMIIIKKRHSAQVDWFVV